MKVSFVFVEFNGGSANAAVMTRVVLLAWLFCSLFFCLVPLFVPVFSLPPGLSRYLLPLRRAVSSVQPLSVPLQHIRCSSCSLSDLASHSSELLSFPPPPFF